MDEIPTAKEVAAEVGSRHEVAIGNPMAKGSDDAAGAVREYGQRILSEAKRRIMMHGEWTRSMIYDLDEVLPDEDRLKR